jgi:glyoxylase-like metal-dependent hydrolase (beta-lactamase superfamily II)
VGGDQVISNKTSNIPLNTNSVDPVKAPSFLAGAEILDGTSKVYLLDDGEGGKIIINSGSEESVDSLIKHIEGFKGPITVFATHGFDEVIGGLKKIRELPNVRVYCSSLEALENSDRVRELKGGNPVMRPDYYRGETERVPGYEVPSTRWSFDPLKGNKHYEDSAGGPVRVGKLWVTPLHTPGPTSNSYSLIVTGPRADQDGEATVAFIGDLLRIVDGQPLLHRNEYRQRQYARNEIGLTHYQQSLDRLSGIPVEAVAPSFGDLWFRSDSSLPLFEQAKKIIETLQQKDRGLAQATFSVRPEEPRFHGLNRDGVDTLENGPEILATFLRTVPCYPTDKKAAISNTYFIRTAPGNLLSIDFGMMPGAKGWHDIARQLTDWTSSTAKFSTIFSHPHDDHVMGLSSAGHTGLPEPTVFLAESSRWAVEAPRCIYQNCLTSGLITDPIYLPTVEPDELDINLQGDETPAGWTRFDNVLIAQVRSRDHNDFNCLTAIVVQLHGKEHRLLHLGDSIGWVDPSFVFTFQNFRGGSPEWGGHRRILDAIKNFGPDYLLVGHGQTTTEVAPEFMKLLREELPVADRINEQATGGPERGGGFGPGGNDCLVRSPAERFQYPSPGELSKEISFEVRLTTPDFVQDEFTTWIWIKGLDDEGWSPQIERVTFAPGQEQIITLCTKVMGQDSMPKEGSLLRIRMIDPDGRLRLLGNPGFVQWA